MEQLPGLVPEPKNDFIQLHEKDGTRKLIIPSREPRKIPGIWTKTNYSKLKNQSQIVTYEDRIALMEEQQRKKNDEKDRSHQRRMQLQKALLEQRPKIDSKLGVADSEAKRKNLYLLQRSFEQMQEQDQRVKDANRIIMAAKCGAIRNAQVAEKELIQKQLNEEERRLDEMMEQRRQGELLKEDRRKEAEEQKKKTYVKELSNQMKLNETEKLLEAERRKEEAKILNKILIATMKEDEEKLKERKRRQIQTRNELTQANMDAERYRQRQLEEERISDIRIATFMKRKQEREEAHEQRLLMAKKNKEREMARMGEAQKSAMDGQAAMDEMNAMRIQEEMERKWRANELRKAQQLKDLQEQLQREREKQMDDLNRAKAIRLQRDEADFQAACQIQKRLLEQENEKKAKQKQAAMNNCRDVLQQINEKERERIKEKQERLEEGKCRTREMEIMDRRVGEYLDRKIEKLRECKAPESFVTEVQAQIKSSFAKPPL